MKQRFRARFSWRRFLHSTAFFLGVFLVLALFFVALVVAESTFYALTGRAVSTWALVLAALLAAMLFSPLVKVLQHGLDRLFFRRYLDILEAIRHLGAVDLATLPVERLEQALLARICKAGHRRSAALVEVEGAGDTSGDAVHVFPAAASPPPIPSSSGPPLRLQSDPDYELCIELPRQSGRAWLYLGPHEDGTPTEDDEIEALKGVAQFAAMSLEHARLSRRLAQSARLDSLSRVASQLHSHDLKNRLNDLVFLAHHLGSGRLDAEDARRLVAAIRKVATRMQTLMQRLADPQAPLHPELVAVDFCKWLREAVSARNWPEAVQVEMDLPSSLPPVAADPAMLGSVFENLFDNAVKAMGGHGRLHLRAFRTQSGIEVQVTDDGCGMSEEFLQRRLFSPFSTHGKNGLGIGLYLSKRVIDAHRGEIWAESGGRGKGCTFHVRLPLWQSDRPKEGACDSPS